MKLLVIGQSLVDNINYQGKSEIRPGGIFYSILGLKSFIKKEDEIFLCTSLEREKLGLFSPTYDDLNKEHFQYTPSMPEVFLNITDSEEREECYSKLYQGLNIGINGIASFDGILINMITGFDVTVKQVQMIRNKFKGLIYFDVHTLARGIDEKGTRNFRTIPDFENWAKNIDILQVNEVEFTLLFDYKYKYEIIKKLFECGIKILLITKGEIGAKVFYKKKDEIVSAFVSSLKVETKNKVGCGDIFGSAFFYDYICFKNINRAMALANIAGGITASYGKFEDFKNLGWDVDAQFH